ncbi:hypothetical protein [Pseudomonas sp. 37 R 15]|nr:hypothetical protein [Pseudomonas sp. 37 R 15]CRM64875.1 hypothetical protein [Pseudomonas sp. 37 R 15]
MFPTKPSSELKIYRKECSSKSLLIFEGKLSRLCRRNRGQTTV